MKELILKINYILFSWYYTRIDDHFKQWTFFKSVDLLRQNYQHDKLLQKNAHEHIRALIKDNDELRKELHSIRMQQVASPDQITSLNRMFGTDFDNPKDN